MHLDVLFKPRWWFKHGEYHIEKHYLDTVNVGQAECKLWIRIGESYIHYANTLDY